MADAALETPAAPVVAPPPPAVEQPWGSSVLDFGLTDDAPAETPLPGAPKEAAAETPKQAVAEDEKAEPKPEEVAKPKEEAAPVAVPDKPAEEAKPGDVPEKPKEEAKPATEDDPELTAEDNELVRTRPAAEQPELKDRLKKASFISQYKDPDTPAEGTIEALRKISPSSFARVEGALIAQRLADPVKFLNELPAETYGKLMADGFRADPAWFTKQITGRSDLTPQQVKERLDFYEHNKDRVAEGPAGEELSPEIIEQIKLYLGDDADKVIAATRRVQPAAPAEVDAEKEQLRTKVAEYESKASETKTKEQQEAEKTEQAKAAEAEKAIKLEVEKTWDTASAEIEGYLETFADDSKAGLGLKVTEQERELAPEVADLKDFKRSVLFDGIGDLPDFRKGLIDWSKALPEKRLTDFNKKLATAYHFADARETDNAKTAARALLPYVEQYKQERLKAPIFARIDNLLRIAAAGSNPKTENETIIPGAPRASSPQGSSDPQGRIVDLLLDAATAP